MSTSAATADVKNLTVGDAMHPGVVTCDRATPLSDVAATMAREHIHCVVVSSGSGDAGEPWGIVSDLDLVAAALVRDLREQTAGASAASPVVIVSGTEPLDRAAQLMTEHGTSHLLVAERSTGRPVGVLSTIDIAKALTTEEER